MKWNTKDEMLAQSCRDKGMTFKEISASLGVTPTSVKHKIRRLSQALNKDKYKHTKEKLDQLNLVSGHLLNSDIHILETHCGFGGMSENYSLIGNVEGYDIDKSRAHTTNMLHENITAIHGDSEQEVFRLISHKCIYDIVDIDPYGFPSRYFPHAFRLINDGLMFLTFPVMGVAQINKITIRHYMAFWGIKLSDKERYIDLIKAKLEDFAFQNKRGIDFLDIRKIGRIYRLAIRVKRRSLCEIVGLDVNRHECKAIKDSSQLELL